MFFKPKILLCCFAILSFEGKSIGSNQDIELGELTQQHEKNKTLLQNDTKNESFNKVSQNDFQKNTLCCLYTTGCVGLVMTQVILAGFTLKIIYDQNTSIPSQLQMLSSLYNSPLIRTACQDVVKNMDTYTSAYDNACPQGAMTVPLVKYESDSGMPNYYTLYNCSDFWGGFSKHIHPNNSSHILYSPLDYGLVKYSYEGKFIPLCLDQTCLDRGERLTSNAARNFIEAVCPGTVAKITSSTDLKRALKKINQKLVFTPQKQEFKYRQKQLKQKLNTKGKC